MRVFDGNQLYTNLNQIDFKNKIAKGVNSKGEDFEINFINLDYPIRIKSGDQDIYENDIVSYLNNNWKIVFDYTKGVFGIRKENKKKYKIYLGPGLKIVGNIYMKEFEEFKGL